MSRIGGINNSCQDPPTWGITAIISDMQYLDNDSTAQKKMTRVAKKKIYVKDVGGRKGSFIALLFLPTLFFCISKT